MIGMARSGAGSSYYGETAADLMDPFREEFDLLNALCARRLRLEIEPAPGVQLRLLNEYESAGDHAWWLPDLAYGGEAWALARCKVRRSGIDGRAALAKIALRYTGMDGEPRAIQPLDFTLPALPAAAFGTIAEDELVRRRAGELEAAEIQQRARLAAANGDWDRVTLLLRKAQQLGADNPWVAAVVGELQQLASGKDEVLFAKASAYSARRMQTRLAEVHESAAVGDARAAYLRRKSKQGKADGPSPR